MTDGVTIEPSLKLILMIPTREKCLQILKERHISENIIEHSKRATRNALFIGKHFSEKVDLQLLEAAGLLHDICKMEEVNGKIKDHGLVAAEKLKEMGFEELYGPVARHTLWRLVEEDFHNWSNESIILAYADTIDVNNKIDSIENAFKRYRKRYPQFLEMLGIVEPS